MKQLILLVVAAVVLVGVVIFLYSRDNVEVPMPTPTPTPTSTSTSEKTPISLSTPIAAKLVIYSDFGYSPSTVTVKKGNTIIFDNQSSKIMWTASAVHPTHKAYPGSDIAKCGTPAQNDVFDACKGVGLGESWEFKFSEQGTWKYHNHLQPNHTGTIIVE